MPIRIKVRLRYLVNAIWAGVFAFGILASAGVVRAEENTFTFGIVPQQSATRLAKIWVPLFDEVSKQTGFTIRFTTTKDIPSFENCLAQGAYDFAYMNPYHYVVFSEVSDYRAFARQKDKQLKGIVVVRNDSSASDLQDLADAPIAFPSPAAFGASVIPRAELAVRGVPFTPHYVKSHDSVYRSVAAGLMEAGGGVGRTFNTVAEDVRNQLRILYRTQGYTPHAFAARQSVSDGKVEAVFNALSSAASTKPEMLQALGMKGFTASSDADWDDIRGLSLDRTQTQIVGEGDSVCRSG